MGRSPQFNFGDQSVAAAYDTGLVPILFDPWAAQLVEDFQPWEGLSVLDLATGTGIATQWLAKYVGPEGKVVGTDVNGEMLALAKQRCAGASAPVEFIASPAHALDLPNEFVDVVVCQQGFQFFPDKLAAAEEIFRVLRRPGKAIVTTWCPVSECEFFGKICAALTAVGEVDLSDTMRVPFDFMPESELSLHFERAGFDNVRVTQQQRALIVPGGVPQAIEAAYSTPIGPKLRTLGEEQQLRFRTTLAELLKALSTDGQTMGRMVSNVLSADKPR